MQMTEGEIRRNYGAAKNKKEQISILADLNACSTDHIKRILGIDETMEKVLRAEPQEPTKSEILNVLFAKMDQLDNQIKSLEKEYKDVHTAIEVISALGKGA